MAMLAEERKKLLAETKTSRAQDRRLIAEYLERSGLHRDDFARRIGYAPVSMRFLMDDSYHLVSSNDLAIRAAARDFIARHPVGPETAAEGKLYRTSNYQLLHKYFQLALDLRRIYYVEGDPATQKSFIAHHLIAELNRVEVSKNGAGRRAYYIYCAAGMTPRQFLKRIAEACGSPVLHEPDRILRNLRFDFRGRKVVLVFDEAQHLDVACLETVRELYDRPPHFGLLFLGSHAFGELFARNALRLEQWNSRFHAGKTLPGMSEEEAIEAIRGELGKPPREVIEKLLKGARVPHLRSGGKQTYISARRLFEALADLKQPAGSGEQEAAS